MMRSRTVIGSLLRTAGGILVAAGAVVLLFVAYELWITNFIAGRDQRRLHAAIEHDWLRPPAMTSNKRAAPGIPVVKPGAGLAILHIPRLGRGYAPVVVEGVTETDLRKGPGHYPGTALPGEIGNFVVSGHRTTYRHPFGDLDKLRVGDPIVIEVADRYYTYLVTLSEVVDPDDLAVILPVPDHPGMHPTRALMTATTCNPRYSASTRLVVEAQLHSLTMKSRHRPSVSLAARASAGRE
jgi:sortase A